MKFCRRSFHVWIILVVVLSLTMLGQSPQPARAATISVPADYATIQEAIAAASDGDTITVAAGSYAGGITIDKAITLTGIVGTGQGAAANAPIIDGTLGGASGISITAANVTVAGFTIQHFAGGASTGSGIRIGAGGDHATIRHMTIQNTNWAGVLAWTDGTTLLNGLVLENNVVTMGAWSPNTNVYGIECTNCTNAKITTNTITGGYVGIALTAQGKVGQSVTATGTTLASNTLSGSAFAALQLVAFDPAAGEGTPALTDIMIGNNTIAVADSNTTGIFVYPLGSGSIAGVTIAGNTLNDTPTQTAQITAQQPNLAGLAQTLSTSSLMLAATQTDANMLDLRNMTNLVIMDNTLSSTGRSGAMLFIANSDQVNVSNNTFTSTNASGHMVSFTTCQNVTLQTNTITVTDPLGSTSDWRNHAVDVYVVGGTVLIDNNRITIQTSSVLQTDFAHGSALQNTFYHGINVQGAVDGTCTISNNTLLGNGVGTESTGIRLRAPLSPAQIIAILLNKINGFAYGIRTDTLPTGMNVRATENHLADNGYGIFTPSDGATVGAENNWWGSPTGPNHPDNPRGNGVKATGKLDYTPWLVSDKDADPSTPGFQPEENPAAFIGIIYMPMILQFPVENPPLSTGSDLSVKEIRLVPDKQTFTAGEEVTIIVEITNQGFQQANPFWVDLYMNPATPPDRSGILWHTTCTLEPCLGIVWQVGTLNPGSTTTLSNTITLTSTAASYYAPYTVWPGWFANGTTDLYVYVDSWGGTQDDAGGAVTELDEHNNLGALHGLTVTGTNPAIPKTGATLQNLPRPGHPRQESHGE